MSQDKEREAWKVGNEFAPYHPDASHVDPQYRDGWNACYRAALASQQAVKGEPQWREHVEQRIRTWRQRTMNKSGDRLAIDDFMGQDSIDDLVDFVCDEWAAPPSREPLTDDAILDAFCHTPGIHQFVQAFKAGVRFAERAHGIHSRGEGDAP